MLTSGTLAPQATELVLNLEQNAIRTHAVRYTSKPPGLEPLSLAITYANGQIHMERREPSVPFTVQFAEIDNRTETRIVTQIVLTFKADPTRTAPALIELWGNTPPTKPTTRGLTRSASPQPSATQLASKPEDRWLAVPLLYGTTRKQDRNRQKNGVDLAAFTGDFNPQLTLGTAIVTVPIEREPGSIPRPPGVIFEFRREDPTKDFTLARVETLADKAFDAELSRRAAAAKNFNSQAFIFIHGFNVSFDDALFRTAQITHDMGFDGAAVLYSWPSRGSVFSYLYDLDTAKLARDGLHQLIQLVAANSQVHKINVIAHSLGNEPLIEVLKAHGRAPAANRPNLKLNEIVFASPDVSVPFFQQLATDVPSIPHAGMTLYANNNDKALRLSDKSRVGMVRAGDAPTTGPIFVAGVESIDVSAADTAFFYLNHGTFADRRPMIDDLRALFARGMHPPEQRFPMFKRQGPPKAPWWTYLHK